MSKKDYGVDWDVIRRAISGDEEAWAQIYNDTKPQLMSQALALTKNHEDAEELVCKTFERVFYKLPSFLGQSQLLTWMTTIERNLFLMDTRKRKLTVSLEDHLRLCEQDGASGSYIEVLSQEDKQLTGVINRLSLAKAIKSLNHIYHHAIVLREVEDYNIVETAKILGISTPSMKSRHARAKMKLRKILTRKSVYARSNLRIR